MSVGTAMPAPQSMAMYDTYHWYVVSPIMRTFSPLSLKALDSPVPRLITSSLNFPYDISSKDPFLLNFSRIKVLSLKRVVERSNTSFIVE